MIYPNKSPFIIAGPCSAESFEQLFNVYTNIKDLPYVTHMRVGIWKPRTRGGQFEGLGEEALPWVETLQKEGKLELCLEVATPKHLEALASLAPSVKTLWIGARTVTNPFAVEELASAMAASPQFREATVMIKNPINPDVNLWRGAIERFLRHGFKLSQLMAIHRGFSLYHKTKQWRSSPCWKIPFELKRHFPDLSVLHDPSHLTGKREAIFEASQRAICYGFEGLMIEVHPSPEEALSDAQQQITPKELAHLIEKMPWRCPTGSGELYCVEERLELLRAQIDELDYEILGLWSLRRKIVLEVASLKKENGLSIVWPSRFKKMMEDRLNEAHKLGLREESVMEMFDLIHEDSAFLQNEHLRQ